ncbi:transcription factor MYB80 [Sorghum bicolor]|uniref:Uncharacterized protein n=1 Tax=Sorghum bicolor TaxID=4558 RepID=A0A1B6Q253_SORBI|nr:transcription factor MYB80 [Sorghum bicolor]KXG31994.1 hypothetical protein SORBI_3003G088300 [Sorghum bicolor]|eukprot:XP_021311767.1 transcription factor MYB80 [Sorghum bicolor]
MPVNRMKQRRWGLSGLQLGNSRPSSSQRPANTAGPLVRSKNNCFCEEEEDLLIKLHTLLGNRWSLIAGRLPGRTAKEVESYWNRRMRSKLKCTGLDPEKHRTTTFHLLPDDDQQWRRRRRPRNACKVGLPDAKAKHPDRPPPFNGKVEEEVVADDDCVSDAGSAC